MSTLPTDSYASLGVPLWLSNPVKELRLEGSPPVILTNNAGVFEVNGQPVESVNTWSLFPTLSNKIIMDASNIIQIIAGDLYFNNDLIAVAGSISNVSDWYLYPALAKVDLNAGVGIDFNGRQLTRSGTDLLFGGVNLNSSAWSSFPALTNVDIGGNVISNATTISGKTGTSNLTLTSSSNLVFQASNAVTATADLIQFTATDLNPAYTPSLTLRSSNGYQGQINLEAGPGTTGFGGEINLTASGGSLLGVGFGGLIEMVATTPVGFSNVTSAIKSSAACVTSYAGITSAIGSTFGYNYIHGDVGANITAGLASVVPNVPGTVYIYGTNGTAVDNGLYADHIYPYTNTLSFPNLKITGNSLTGADVEISNVVKLDGDNLPVTGVNSITMTGTSSIGPLNTLTMSSGAINGLSTINGSPYTPTSNWANYPAVANIDASANQISDVSSITFTPTSNAVGLRQGLGFSGDVRGSVATIPNSSGGGDFRNVLNILSVSRDDPPVYSEDMALGNAGRDVLYNGKQRIIALCATDNQESGLLAYLDDIPQGHGNASSSVRQVMASASTPRVLTYTDIGTLSGGVNIVGSTGRIYTNVGGSYLLTFSIQFARISGGTASIAEAWIRIDGVDVPNSSSRSLLPSGGNGQTIMTVPINVEMTGGQYIEVVFATTDYPDTVCEAYPSKTTPYVAPAVPSVIVNIDQVG
jgi:hypothetical protein